MPTKDDSLKEEKIASNAGFTHFTGIELEHVARAWVKATINPMNTSSGNTGTGANQRRISQFWETVTQYYHVLIKNLGESETMKVRTELNRNKQKYGNNEAEDNSIFSSEQVEEDDNGSINQGNDIDLLAVSYPDNDIELVSVSYPIRSRASLQSKWSRAILPNVKNFERIARENPRDTFPDEESWISKLEEIFVARKCNGGKTLSESRLYESWKYLHGIPSFWKKIGEDSSSSGRGGDANQKTQKTSAKEETPRQQQLVKVQQELLEKIKQLEKGQLELEATLNEFRMENNNLKAQQQKLTDLEETLNEVRMENKHLKQHQRKVKQSLNLYKNIGTESRKTEQFFIEILQENKVMAACSIQQLKAIARSVKQRLDTIKKEKAVVLAREQPNNNNGGSNDASKSSFAEVVFLSCINSPDTSRECIVGLIFNLQKQLYAIENEYFERQGGGTEEAETPRPTVAPTDNNSTEESTNPASKRPRISVAQN